MFSRWTSTPSGAVVQGAVPDCAHAAPRPGRSSTCGRGRHREDADLDLLLLAEGGQGLDVQHGPAVYGRADERALVVKRGYDVQPIVGKSAVGKGAQGPDSPTPMSTARLRVPYPRKCSRSRMRSAIRYPTFGFPHRLRLQGPCAPEPRPAAPRRWPPRRWPRPFLRKGPVG